MTNIRPIILTLCLALVSFFLMLGSAYSDPFSKVNVTSRIEEQSKVVLVFTNQGEKRVTFARNNFEHPIFNMFLVVHGSDEPLNQSFMPDATTSKSIELNAGESYEHVVSLKNFHDFEKIAKRHCLVLYWSTYFEIGTLPNRPFFGGAVNVNCPEYKKWP